MKTYENKDPLRKRRPTKTKTPYENEDLLRKPRPPMKMKTPSVLVGNEIIGRKQNNFNITLLGQN